MNKPILYSYFRSSASHRVRIALHFKKVDFEYRAIHLVKNGGEQKKEEYLKINPKGEVPALVLDGKIVSQSMAIIQLIDAKWPMPPLFPPDLHARALVVQICEVINSGIQPLQNLKVVQEIQKRFKATDQQKDEWIRFWIEEGFTALEKLLASTADKFCLGNMVTAADCFLIPQVFAAFRFGVKVNKFPKILAIHENCLKLEAFVKATPEKQPDFQA